jgi:hypothetical protein
LGVKVKPPAPTSTLKVAARADETREAARKKREKASIFESATGNVDVDG